MVVIPVGYCVSPCMVPAIGEKSRVFVTPNIDAGRVDAVSTCLAKEIPDDRRAVDTAIARICRRLVPRVRAARAAAPMRTSSTGAWQPLRRSSKARGASFAVRAGMATVVLPLPQPAALPKTANAASAPRRSAWLPGITGAGARRSAPSAADRPIAARFCRAGPVPLVRAPAMRAPTGLRQRRQQASDIHGPVSIQPLVCGGTSDARYTTSPRRLFGMGRRERRRFDSKSS